MKDNILHDLILTNWKTLLKWTYPWKMQLSRTHMHEIRNCNSPVSTKEAEFIMKNFAMKKISDPDGFTVEFYHIFKKKYQSYTNLSKKQRKRFPFLLAL